MPFWIEAACACNTGRIRKNNEDNFFFDGRCLEENHQGLECPLTMTKALRDDICVAIMDGMGGENFGECASFTAAECLKTSKDRLKGFLVPEERFLIETAQLINAAVVAKAKELQTSHIGSTLVMLCFTKSQVYSCNLGDSRSYMLREGVFLQLSEDHVEESRADKRKKPRLTQYLGIDPEEVLIEPYITRGKLRRNDQYLLCSDGLTDMLDNSEIVSIMISAKNAKESATNLIHAALEKGGKDNITAIVCRIL